MKFEDFKKCSQSGFCRRHRAYADQVTESPYRLLTDTVLLNNDHVYAEVLNQDTEVHLTLDVHILQDNTARVRINEKAPIRPRYDEHIQHTLQGQPQPPVEPTQAEFKEGVITLTHKKRRVVIRPEPFTLEFWVDDAPVITLNDRGFFHFEHLRTKESHQPKLVEKTNQDGVVEMVEDDTEKDLWEESFKTWTDPKPNGPESIGLDVTFHGFSHVYGIPEHASSLSLKETRGGENAYEEPYRLYNTDVFEYALDSPTALYGAVPLMVAHSKNLSAGLFWMNPSETWIDIVKSSKKALSSTHTHWISEAGVLDLFVFLGPSTKDVLRQYALLTGPPAMPQMFAIGYHQCRWNYLNQRDVLTVDGEFDRHEMPYDVIWLDIEYTEEKKYFSWDRAKFPDPVQMAETLDSKGRKLVTIIDPHIKQTEHYNIIQEAKDQNLLVKKPDGTDYEAWCWPGQSSWIDFAHRAAYDWWKKKFAFHEFKGTRENVYIWNDMNEPSVFNGPEITMQKEMIHDGKWEHRVLHNMYALLSHAATAEGVRERTQVEKRPFVLGRGFYAGVQRVGPIWTGDNSADWDALTYTNPMILANGLGGVVFSGADVPGFFGNPSPELLVRWYQTAVYQPFFRGHAHIDTKRREPYLSEEPYRSMTRDALRERYALLSYWYTLFFEAYRQGTPMMRPMFMEFPQDEALFTTQDQFMLGEAMLVKPITQEGAESTQLYLPENEVWYDAKTYQRMAHHGLQTVDAPLSTIPVYYRGGHIVPRRERIRRSSTAMKHDPFTLVIAQDGEGKAQGKLYLDDEETYAYQNGIYTYTSFHYHHHTLTCQTEGNPSFMSQPIRIERVRILGVHSSPQGVKVVRGNTSQTLEFTLDNHVLTIKDPKLPIAECGWQLVVY
ncbi:glycosyl hydrolases family 31-domain-containing protein [Sporodiniella umbellata]|nr:glycosyl hydrolases family 31-domain-containing protein [Sporodiniella umbellata]